MSHAWVCLHRDTIHHLLYSRPVTYMNKLSTAEVSNKDGNWIEPNTTLTTDTFLRSFLDFFTGFDRMAPAQRSSSSSFLHSRYIPAGSASCLVAEGLSAQHKYQVPFNTSTFTINIIIIKLRREDAASMSTNCLDPWPVYGTRHLCGTHIKIKSYQIILKSLIFAANVLAIHTAATA